MAGKKSRIGNTDKLHRQYAALPVRLTQAGRIEILLVTSRGTQRWIIPKGWPIRKLSPAETAAREAYEEAGVKGETLGLVGRYRYRKRIADGTQAAIEVSIFLLHVSRQLAAWPEQNERRTAWFDPKEAAARVAEPELANILRDVGQSLLDSGLNPGPAPRAPALLAETLA